jgi:hypothetical protein
MSGTDSDIPKPYLGRGDLELLFDFFLEHKLDYREDWCRAVAEGEAESFLAAFCRKLANDGCAIRIVKTKEDGTKIVADLSRGFVTTVFDVDI